jgi:hypothetical protein
LPAAITRPSPRGECDGDVTARAGDGPQTLGEGGFQEVSGLDVEMDAWLLDSC